ncbi:hypothetical protein BD770DRAFT_406359 [Pilaira anomala]|nr:hypothetical protein BD770DRAFT_406359 [Pilaira anomala]
MSSRLIVCNAANYRLHSTEVNVLVNGVSTRVLRNDDGVFLCPCCSRQKYAFPDSLKRHLKKHFRDQEAKATAQTDNESEGNQSCTDSDTEVDNDDTVAVILDTEITTPLSTAQEVVKEIHSTRDYKTAVLSAFDALSQPSEDQEKKLLIAELGDIKPVAYIDYKGKEHSLLAASKVIDSLTSSQKKEKQPLFLAITPKKRNHSWLEFGG